MKKKSKNIKEKIFDEYSKLALEENGQLKSVYLFCKKTIKWRNATLSQNYTMVFFLNIYK